MTQNFSNPIKLQVFHPILTTAYQLPEFSHHISAGFPSMADDFMEKKLDLNELMVKHPAATFFVRVEGNSMQNAGIYSGDILVVDRSIEASNGKIIVAVVNGEFTVKRLIVTPQGISLAPENEAYPSYLISEGSDFQVWVVVTYVIHRAQ